MPLLRGLAVLAVTLVAGCSTHYYAQLDGDVRGTDPDTPRTVRAGVYQDMGALRAVPGAAGSHFKSVNEGHAVIGLRFGDEKRPRQFETVAIDSAAGRFQYMAAGESRQKLTSVNIRVEAPGWEPVEQTFVPDSRGRLKLHVLAVLDYAPVPPAPAAPAFRPNPPEEPRSRD